MSIYLIALMNLRIQLLLLTSFAQASVGALVTSNVFLLLE